MHIPEATQLMYNFLSHGIQILFNAFGLKGPENTRPSSPLLHTLLFHLPVIECLQRHEVRQPFRMLNGKS